jgi:RNB domain
MWTILAVVAVLCTQSCSSFCLVWVQPPMKRQYYCTSKSSARYPGQRRLPHNFAAPTPAAELWKHAARHDNDDDDDENQQSGCLEMVLQDHGFGQRLYTLQQGQLPVTAEIFVDGHIVMARITSITESPSSFHDTAVTAEPKLVVKYLSTNKHSDNDDDDNAKSPTSNGSIVDFGQVTTIWMENYDAPLDLDVDRMEAEFRKANVRAEPALDRLYRSRVGRARSTASGLTKKQVFSQLKQQGKDSQQQHAETVLRKVLKAGTGFSRLVDSSMAAEYLFTNNNHQQQPITTNLQRAVTARILAQDAGTGGRFKRWPCTYVIGASNSTTFVNGGWLVTDQSVRAGIEARKFVERSLGDTVIQPTTGADERITRRLECLAMGELFASNNKGSRLELDVRETLKAMNLPISPEGAKLALVQTGHWSGNKAKQESLARTIQPWSQPILEAANWYVDTVERNRAHQLEGRVDLTHLPCVSVDAQKATFRDDAIGVRRRAGTGRKPVPEASKWEILIHIADVSDIYSTVEPFDGDFAKNFLSILRQAAENRGTSRYDLPLGPLHLLPPAVLRALAFRDAETSSRCVTMWAYIDERDGRLLDAGIERTLVSSPMKLSFAEATAVMEGETLTNMAKARAILLVAERNVQKWSDYQRQRSEAAQKREARLAARATLAQTVATRNKKKDDGTDGFRRTRAHRLVDAALDLYAYASAGLLRRANAPIPRVVGADASRGGRVATAPLRRYIDGQAQRQLLAVLCDYGRPMSLAECKDVAKVANNARNSIANVRSVRKN